MFGSGRGSLLVVLVACTRLLTAQIIVSPASATLLVGESRRFRAVDERGWYAPQCSVDRLVP